MGKFECFEKPKLLRGIVVCVCVCVCALLLKLGTYSHSILFYSILLRLPVIPQTS